MLSNTAATLTQKSTYQSHIKRSLIAQTSGQGCERSNSPSALRHLFSHGMCYTEVRGDHRSARELWVSQLRIKDTETLIPKEAVSRGGTVQVNDCIFWTISSLNISNLLSNGRKLRSWSERKRAISR